MMLATIRKCCIGWLEASHLTVLIQFNRTVPDRVDYLICLKSLDSLYFYQKLKRFQIELIILSTSIPENKSMSGEVCESMGYRHKPIKTSKKKS